MWFGFQLRSGKKKGAWTELHYYHIYRWDNNRTGIVNTFHTNIAERTIIVIWSHIIMQIPISDEKRRRFMLVFFLFRQLSVFLSVLFTNAAGKRWNTRNLYILFLFLMHYVLFFWVVKINSTFKEIWRSEL